MKSTIRVAAAGAALALTGMGLVACSSTTTSGATGSTIPASEYGPITVVQGKDNNGILPLLKTMWDKQYPKTPVTFKQQSPNADAQLQDLTLHFGQKSTDYDVVSSDVVWTQQLASAGYLQPLTGPYKLDTSALVPAVLNTAKYRGVLYAAPAATDSQILYYNKKLLGSKPVPTTYAEMFADCDIAKTAKIGCYAGQFAKYEGLTVNFSEAVNSAGGTVVDSSGKPTVTTAAAKAGLTTLVNAFKDGDIPPAAITYMEEDGRAAFDAGKLLFYTNWPYAYSLTTNLNNAGDKTSIYSGAASSNLGIAGFPGKSSLGGHNWAISNYSTHKGTALQFVKWFETPAVQELAIAKASAAPVLAAEYTNTALTSKYAYLTTLKSSLDNAVPRPATPFYNAVTTAIQTNAYAAIKGTKTVDQALSDMQTSITQASNG